MIDPVMTLYNHVKRNPLHLGKSLATIQRHRDAGRFDPDLALRLLRNNVTDNVRAMPNDRFTIAHVSAVAVMILADSARKQWDGRSSTLENEQALGTVEYARRMSAKSVQS